MISRTNPSSNTSADVYKRQRYDLPFVQLVDAKGAFVGGTPWDGIFVKKADPDVIEALKAEGKWFKSLRYTHSYPHCWRCDTPLLYYATDTWLSLIHI